MSQLLADFAQKSDRKGVAAMFLLSSTLGSFPLLSGCQGLPGEQRKQRWGGGGEGQAHSLAARDRSGQRGTGICTQSPALQTLLRKKPKEASATSAMWLSLSLAPSMVFHSGSSPRFLPSGPPFSLTTLCNELSC